MIKDVKEAYFYQVDKENIGLAESFSVNPSSCENSDFYRDYLLFTALSDQYSGRCTTHLFVDEEDKKIMGFISLRASSLISQNENGVVYGEPAIEISVLAVNQAYERRGVGRTLVDFAIAEAEELHHYHLGVRYLILAADPKAESFYKKMGFVPMEELYQMPKEGWSAHCLPMLLDLDFESENVVAFTDDDDEEE